MRSKEPREKLDKSLLHAQIFETVQKLEAFNMDRRQIEREINYTENSLDVVSSRGGSEKLLTALHLLLKTKMLQKAIEEKESPALGQAKNDVNFSNILDRIDKSVSALLNITVDAREHTLLSESLLHGIVSHSAYMEQKQYGGDYTRIVEAIQKVTSIAYQRLRQTGSVGPQSEKVA